MLDVLPPRTARLATPGDIPVLEKAFPEGPRIKHQARIDQQENGEGIYLIATLETPLGGRVFQSESLGTSVYYCGHVYILWTGAELGPAKDALTECPEIQDLFVHSNHRNRKVATRLMDMAERLAAKRGYKQIGLGCGTANTDAARFYEARGYKDTGLGTYQNVWDSVNAEGIEETHSEECTYLVLTLAPATEEAPSVSDTPVTDEKEEETMAEETAKDGKERSVTDKVVDFTFGMAVLAAETVDKTIKTIGERAKEFKGEAPNLFEAVSEKGRPARERLIKGVREDALNPFVAVKGNISSAENEIQTLEERVKALEAQVGPPVATYEPVTEAEPTPAESSTVVVDFTPETATPTSLADSSYAITDQEEESAALAQLHAETAEAETVVEIASEAVAEATEVEPEKPKRTRKKKAEETETEGESV